MITFLYTVQPKIEMSAAQQGTHHKIIHPVLGLVLFFRQKSAKTDLEVVLKIILPDSPELWGVLSDFLLPNLPTPTVCLEDDLGRVDLSL